jgi:hypothetical protein
MMDSHARTTGFDEASNKQHASFGPLQQVGGYYECTPDSAGALDGVAQPRPNHGAAGARRAGPARGPQCPQPRAAQGAP